jgi:hypothetical protein
MIQVLYDVNCPHGVFTGVYYSWEVFIRLHWWCFAATLYGVYSMVLMDGILKEFGVLSLLDDGWMMG